MNKKPTKTETCIIGSWVAKNGSVVQDDVCERIHWLIENVFNQITVNGDNWSALYINPEDNFYWELTYPNSHMQGGGPPALERISVAEVKTRYPIEGSGMDFVTLACEVFGPITDKYRLSIVKVKPNWVKFSSNIVSLTISYDANVSHEIGVVMGNLKNAELGAEFSLNLIYEWQGLQPIGTFQATLQDPEFKVLLIRLEEGCRKACIDLLQGDQTAFRELEKYSLKTGETYALRLSEKHLYQDVEAAWVRKDYCSIVNMLDSTEAKIPAVIMKKLYMARKKTQTK